MKTIRILVAALLMTTVLAVNAGLAAMPATLSYQGSLYQTDGTPVDGTKSMTFKMYTVDTGGTAFWTQGPVDVTVIKGHYSVVLTGLDISKFTGNTWLGIKVEPDSEMLPREQLTSVPFAFNGVPQGGIIMWNGSASAVPAGWALCDGVNGTPDLRSRFIVGASAATGPSGLTKYDWTATGTKGGAETVTLTLDQIPSHNHTDGNANRSLSYYYPEGWNSTRDVDTSPGEPAIIIGKYNVLYQGGGQAHENRPPYYALAYIMKL